MLPFVRDLKIAPLLEDGKDVASQTAQIGGTEHGANSWWAPWVPPNPLGAPIPTLTPGG